MMMNRRTVLGGLAATALSGCASPETRVAITRTVSVPSVPAPTNGLDAVIDISHLVQVDDFTLVRRHSNIRGVFHKASEGGDWSDAAYAVRKPQAEAAGLLWGAYHFGTRQYSGEDQAASFLAAAQPGPATLMALDFEPNDRHPANTMTIAQAEAFVRAVQQATGRLPLVYTHPTWANGGNYGHAGLSLGQSVSPQSILARCDLWLADYRFEPELPWAWSRKGWRFWQYAGNDDADNGAYGSAPRSVAGVDHCDRNLFSGDVAALYRYWDPNAPTS